LSNLKLKYKVNYFEDVSLYTIRHANDLAIDQIEQKGALLLKQATKETVQVIMQ
jgi:aspartate kinase